jgi:hypothetical protein
MRSRKKAPVVFWDFEMNEEGKTAFKKERGREAVGARFIEAAIGSHECDPYKHR